MTGQGQFDSYEWAGVVVAVDLVNELTLKHAFGRPIPRTTDPVAAVRGILGADPTWPPLHEEDLPDLITLAVRLREVFRELHQGEPDVAAGRLNDLLAAHPAHPHLAKDSGRWRLHHHPADATLVPMTTAICAEAMARMIGAGADGRLGMCAGDNCDRVFLDGSKNGSRRFCSITCQNRVKAAAFRRRRAMSDRA